MVLSDITNLGRYSKSLIVVKCDKCLCEKEIKYKLYTEYGYCDGVYFCRSCKLKSNNLEKYGVENVFQLDSVKDKSKKTNLEKYGCEFISQSASILEKKQKNCLEKYGETHHLKNKSIYDKLVKTNLSKYGVDNISQHKDVKNKIKQSTSLSENVLINLPCNANIYIDEVFYGTNTDNPSENVVLNFPYKRDWKIRITSRGYFDWEAIYGN